MPSEVTRNGTASPTPAKVTYNGTAPPGRPAAPLPSEVTAAHARAQQPAAGVFRRAMSALRKTMRGAPRHA